MNNTNSKTRNVEVKIPNGNGRIEQDKEEIVVKNGKAPNEETIRLHDYGKIYEIAGLYEHIFYEKLRCCSPLVVSNLLKDLADRSGMDIKELRVLDFGAGNGIVGEQLKNMGCKHIVGVDILPEAKDAAYRDRPNVYDDYYVMDLSQPSSSEMKGLTQHKFNCLITVAALGFGDIPVRAFLNAFNIVDDNSFIAFNIKDRFLTKDDQTGFKEALKKMTNNNLCLLQKKRYCHRLALNGDKLYYVVITGQKINDVNANEIL